MLKIYMKILINRIFKILRLMLDEATELSPLAILRISVCVFVFVSETCKSVCKLALPLKNEFF